MYFVITGTSLYSGFVIPGFHCTELPGFKNQMKLLRIFDKMFIILGNFLSIQLSCNKDRT